MDKVVRDGKVAVVYSAGHGAGWYSWNDYEDHRRLLFDPKIVAMVEAGRRAEITSEWIEKELGLKKVYCGGCSCCNSCQKGPGLRIEWLPQGTIFKIDEHDGAEEVVVVDLTLVA